VLPDLPDQRGPLDRLDPPVLRVRRGTPERPVRLALLDLPVLRGTLVPQVPRELRATLVLQVPLVLLVLPVPPVR
jgi:hypothetical protein